MNQSHQSKPASERLVRLAEVKLRTGLSRSTIYLAIKNDQFPKPVNLGMRSVGWLESEINLWIADRIQQRK